MARLTLCMIVKNEADMLGDCLDSVRGVVDQVVVVDTGSDDGTVAIAEAAGATVVHHAWTDDFAAARNAALAHVQDGYVLLLDADERIAPGKGKALRKLAKRGRLDGALLPLHNADRIDATAEEVLSGEARLGEPMLLARLYRRTEDLRWEGRVHEHVTAWAQAAPRKIEPVDVPIVHYGAIPELRVQRGKAERNLRLLQQVAADEPDNVVYRTYLAQDLLNTGQVDEARATAEEAWEVLERHVAEGRALPNTTPLVTLRAFLALREDELETAATTLERARSLGTVHPNLGLLECVLAERELILGSDFEAASERARRALEAGRESLRMHGRMFTASTMPGATSWSTATRLGMLHLLLNEPAEAIEQFRAALVGAPGNPEALLGLAEALALTGRSPEVLELGERLIATDTPDAWILIGVATLQQGTREDLLVMLERAQATLSQKPLVAEHRRWFLEELWGQVEVSKAG